jgi:hypothetical protein
MCQLSVFPHNPGSRFEFETQASFTAWLMTGIKAVGGKYLITNQSSERPYRPEDLPAGSIVLFRYHDNLVAEAVVRHYTREPGKDADDGTEYAAKVIFAPSSIRVFSPPVPVTVLQKIINDRKDLSGRNSYTRVEEIDGEVNWMVYPKLLAAHIRGELPEHGWQRDAAEGREGSFL